MGICGTPEQWLAWLTGPDARKRKEATLILGGLSPANDVPLNALVEALGSENGDLVFWSTIGLGCLGCRAAAAVSELIRVANCHGEFGTRQAAISALSRVANNNASAKKAVLRGLEDSNPFVRREALQALIEFDSLSKEDLRCIKAMERDPDEAVASWSEIALRNIRVGEKEGAIQLSPDADGRYASGIDGV